MKEWIANNETLVWWMGGISIVTFIGALIAVPIIVSRMRDDYFIHEPDESENSMKNQRPVAWLVGLIAKNVLGGLLILAGIVMSLPLVLGQGFLTILIGLVIMDFPGKRKLELMMFRITLLRAAVNWMRKKRGRNPLILPAKGFKNDAEL
ncbi:hypothetical protein OAK81_03035 [Verrucomicrobiales bacterium]|nr:hypothetical protein [bacterium]MDB4617649.1 hypothetical protein [Verrucomicrobiales bacterium]MDC0276539.1 hypothetical protein [Verrucomicrobiales bacterium]MDC0292247.1 hypothetical protein [Verrucomicrobiales bacterium]